MTMLKLGRAAAPAAGAGSEGWEGKGGGGGTCHTRNGQPQPVCCTVRSGTAAPRGSRCAARLRSLACVVISVGLTCKKENITPPPRQRHGGLRGGTHPSEAAPCTRAHGETGCWRTLRAGVANRKTEPHARRRHTREWGGGRSLALGAALPPEGSGRGWHQDDNAELLNFSMVLL